MVFKWFEVCNNVVFFVLDDLILLKRRQKQSHDDKVKCYVVVVFMFKFLVFERFYPTKYL